ncbi:MAG: hypothetical protein IPN95_08350 [Bacteroidetes bacterium]|nr:hypothetical protein [Bacteroidota bacterium]
MGLLRLDPPELAALGGNLGRFDAGMPESLPYTSALPQCRRCLSLLGGTSQLRPTLVEGYFPYRNDPFLVEAAAT